MTIRALAACSAPRVADSAITTCTPESSSMYAMRSAGSEGSSGK